MISFHNDKKIKAKYVARVIAHQKADHLIRGTGWDNGKGCAVGCTLEEYSHKKYESELGIPEWLARVEDTLFEGMSEKKSRTWPEKFLKACPVGVDLDKVKGKFMIVVVNRALKAVDQNRFPEVAAAMKAVVALYKAGSTDRAAFQAARQRCWDARRASAAASAAAATTLVRTYDFLANELLKLLKAAK